MKKGLIGIAILALVILLSGPALATQSFQSINFNGSLEWTIFDETGLMPGATKDGPTLALPQLTISVGAWEASTDGDIKYSAEIGSISLKNSVGYGIYGLGAGIGEAQGILLGTDLAPLSLDLVYTTNAEYGIGGKYSADAFSLGAKYNSTGAYGVELVVPLAPITLTGQYATGPAYLVKGAYALSAGTITLQYKVTSAPEISAELAGFPIAATTTLKIKATNTEGATNLTGEIVTTLVKGVKLTLAVGRAAGEDFTYSGKIGVSF